MEPFASIAPDAPAAEFRNVMGGPNGPQLPDPRQASLLLDIQKLIELSNVQPSLAPVYASLLNDAVEEGDDYELNALLYNLQVSRAKNGTTAKQMEEVLKAQSNLHARQEANLKAMEQQERALGMTR